MGKAANEHYELIRNANILAIPEKARGITNKFVMPLAFSFYLYSKHNLH
jgi:hypothetical protein